MSQLTQAAEVATAVAISDVRDERRRQIVEKGYELAADDLYAGGALALAGASYALAAARRDPLQLNLWPWAWTAFKPGTRRRNLVKAAALIIADIERLDRAAKG